LAQFIFEHSDISIKWFKDPYLAQLSCANEDDLKYLIEKLQNNNIKYSIFREPDLDNQITAIAIEPSDQSRRILSSYPLMLKEYNLYNKLDKNSYQKTI
jgi:sensor histidine kinase YesM